MDCTTAPACGNAQCPATLACTGTVIGNVLNAGLVFIGPVTIILIIVAGFRFVTSQGDSKQLEGARKTLTFAIVGLAVVVFSYLLINLIGTITGVKCIFKFDADIFQACQ